MPFRAFEKWVVTEMVKGLPVIQETEETCEECIVGKQRRDSIPKIANWRANEKLQLVHSDICRPINPTSNGGSRYFITFTDDFSRKTWTYVLTEKSNALAIFKKFKAIAEKETSCQIKCLRTDRGGEFISTAFNDFCSENGIKRQLTAAYTPQQNGVSERKNMTLMNMVRSMLAGMNVPKRIWPEAVLWATYVLNRSPTMSVKDMTPEEAWSNVKPSVHYFKVFGCLMYLLATRPDLTFYVCLIARYMDKPTELHLAAAKRVLRYLKGTIGFGVWYKKENERIDLQGWTDSDYAGDLDDRKSTSGYVFTYGSGPISWSSKKQAIVTLSTTEAEFVAAASCACQAIWLKRILDQISKNQSNGVVIWCDNSSSVKLSKNHVMHGRCKHIDVRFHFLRDLTKEGVVKIEAL
ncbi:secreted RxLR effector protein [Trifolium repens]|nr:secreted RxLR effector protein [Trifolium repens]